MTPMTMVAAITAMAGMSQRTGNRRGWVRQLVSATTVCRSLANQFSSVLAAMIFRRASRKQTTFAATSSSRISLGSHDDPAPARMNARAVQQAAIAADLQM
jgi:23S rRNA A1618 N6-methylase RlmF